MLKHIAETIGKQKRAEDVLGQIGGEEFVLLLVDPNIDPIHAAERLRERVATSSFIHAGNTLAATVSGGLAIYPTDGNDWDALFGMADRRLYESKRSGRNRVTGPQICDS
jgi:diguanylate cyclase (GGDEF)-like protein